MNYVFVDFEMNPIRRAYKDERKICKNEIIEIGAVILDENYEEFKSYKQYVKPVFNERISQRVEELTSITNETVENAPLFKDAIIDFIDFCVKYCGKDNYTVYAWSGSDLEQLEGEVALKGIDDDDNYRYMVENWVDFQKEYSKILHIHSKMSLEKAISSIEKEFDGQQHDAMWDARNTARLFSLSRDKEKFVEIMSPILETFKEEKEPVSTTLGELFNFDGIDFGE